MMRFGSSLKLAVIPAVSDHARIWPMWSWALSMTAIDLVIEFSCDLRGRMVGLTHFRAILVSGP